jgi:hypothetical protein
MFARVESRAASHPLCASWRRVRREWRSGVGPPPALLTELRAVVEKGTIFIIDPPRGQDHG